MTRTQQDAAAAMAASKAQQARTKQKNAAACQLCKGTGYARDTAGECRWACVCGAADNNKTGEAA